MKLNLLLEKLNYQEIIGSTEVNITDIQFDSRNINQGSLFVAISGTANDGHEYIESAVSFGAVVVVCEKAPTIRYDGVTFIVVENSRNALARLSSNFYSNPSEELNMIGVTGTNGKTTITFLIAELLENIGKSTAIIGTTGIYIAGEKLEATHTTPDPISLNKLLRQIVDQGIEYVVMEVSSHSLAQNRVDYIDFDLAIFTNLTHDHLDYHKTFEAYLQAKKILFDNLKAGAKAIINLDDNSSKAIVQDTKANIITIGWNKEAEFKLSNEHFDHNGSTFTINNGSGNYDISSPLLAQFNIINLTLSLAAVSTLCNVNLPDLVQDLSYLKAAPGRMDRVSLKNGAVAVIDYAHTPDALEKAGKACKELLDGANSKLIIVFGCGGDRDRAKRPLMAKASQKYADISIITDDNPRTESREQIFADIEKGLIDNDSYQIIKDRSEAIRRATELSQKGDIILIAGKGHENYQIIGTVKHHFNDIEEVSKY